MSIEWWLTYLVTTIILSLSPGSRAINTMTTAISHGYRGTAASIAGLQTGLAIHIVLVGIGLGALFSRSLLAFEILKWAGVAYLIWLGVKIFRASSLLADCSANDRCGSEGHWFSSLRKGLITNISNPKALLFCSVLLPQFIESGTNGVAPQFLLLGCILVITGCLFDFLYVVVGEALRGLLAKSLLARAVQRWSFASMLIGFGIRMAFEERAG